MLHKIYINTRSGSWSRLPAGGNFLNVPWLAMVRRCCNGDGDGETNFAKFPCNKITARKKHLEIACPVLVTIEEGLPYKAYGSESTSE